MPERPKLTEREVRIAMLELRAEIRAANAESRKLAPTWEPKAAEIKIGPCCCLPPNQAARSPKPRRM